MQKLAPLSLILCLALSGCQLFKRSSTWDTVSRVRVEAPASDDPSTAYAEELHRVLLRDGVPHQVVTYSYTGSQRFYERSGSRTAVIYSDHTSPGSPFWLMDDQLSRPLWLPNTDLEGQLRFFVRAKTITEVTSKSYLTDPSAGPQDFARVAPENRPTGVTRISPASEYREAAPSAATQDPTPQHAEREPSTLHVITSTVTAPVRYVIRHLRGPSSDQSSVEHAHESADQTPPTVTPSSERSEPSHEDLFRRKHGSRYNPASATDRKKMASIKRAHR